MRNVTHIVIHCTATAQSATVQSIQNYWRSIGWRRPGYHRLITPDGTVHTLAYYSQITNGVKGHNSNSIHIAYIGGVANGRPVDNRTPQQMAAMEKLVREALVMFPGAKVLGHRDFSTDKNRDGIIQPNEWTKACPSFSVKTWLHDINIHSA